MPHPADLLVQQVVLNELLSQRHDRPSASGRIFSDSIPAVRWYHRSLKHDPQSANPFAEDCVATFSIVEEGATMGNNAQALDSIVLAGAKVGRNATVVRSVICPGAVVPDQAVVMDEVISVDSPRSVFRKQAVKA